MSEQEKQPQKPAKGAGLRATLENFRRIKKAKEEAASNQQTPPESR
jgi:hypothetical protein